MKPNIIYKSQSYRLEWFIAFQKKNSSLFDDHLGLKINFNECLHLKEL